jgi:hypothetical protein
VVVFFVDYGVLLAGYLDLTAGGNWLFEGYPLFPIYPALAACHAAVMTFAFAGLRIARGARQRGIQRCAADERRRVVSALVDLREERERTAEQPGAREGRDDLAGESPSEGGEEAP